MTIRHIQTFLAVVDSGCSISRAAELLHVAQPAVSQTIGDLEAYYGIHLFDRLNRKLFLTDTGRRMLPYARRSVDDFNIFDAAMKEGESQLPLRVGASLTVGTVVLPAVLRGLHFPVEVMVRNTTDIETALIESRLDIALVEGTIYSADIIQKPVMNDVLVAVCTPEYDAEKKDAVWILREKGSGSRALTDMAFAVPAYTEHKTKPWLSGTRTWSIANTETILELVKAGLGITVISKRLVISELESGMLRDCTKFCLRPGTVAAERTFRLVYHKDKMFDSRMGQFAACSSEVK
jgi:LysR family transcriptional regulator, transcriptional activator of the cysJI operon